MTIEPQPIVVETARHFGVDPALIQAVYTAEGGTPETIIRAVQCSVPSVVTEGEAVAVLCRSAVHALSDFVKAQHGAEFVTFWGARWAPLGVANDPTGLNRNWPGNVLRGWLPQPVTT